MPQVLAFKAGDGQGLHGSWVQAMLQVGPWLFWRETAAEIWLWLISAHFFEGHWLVQGPQVARELIVLPSTSAVIMIVTKFHSCFCHDCYKVSRLLPFACCHALRRHIINIFNISCIHNPPRSLGCSTQPLAFINNNASYSG